MPMSAATTTTTTQEHLDEVAFDLFVDCGCNVAETVFQSGLAASTVRARVRRHSRRLSDQDIAARREAEGQR